MYIGSRIGVVYSDKDFLNKWFDDFFEIVDESSIQKVIKQGVDIYVQLKDGTCIRSVRVSRSARGNAFDKIYVDPSVDVDSVEFQTIIKPLLKMPRIQIERDFARKISEREDE